MNQPSAEDIAQALSVISRDKSPLVTNGLAMLKAHYRASGRVMSATGLAGVIGNKKYGVGNIGYGKFCHRLADIMGHTPDIQVNGDTRWTYTLCNANPTRDRNGDFLWALKHETCQALESLGMVKKVADLNALEDIENASALINSAPEKSRTALIQARIGQGVFREWVMRFWDYSCAVTGLAVPELLVASHIKPWRDCTADEAIAMPNGLLLSPNLDKAFDKGYISFNDDGKILLSQELSASAAAILGIDEHMHLSKSLQPEHCEYLDHHRRYVFLG